MTIDFAVAVNGLFLLCVRVFWEGMLTYFCLGSRQL